MKCPKCEAQLESRKVGGVAAGVCDNCEGIWLSADVVIVYMKEHLEKAGLPNKTVGLLATPPVDIDLNCPSCGTKRLRRLRLRGVEVEQCGECHGTFFDRGELIQIAERLGFATRDSRDAEEKRLAGGSHLTSMPGIERAMGDAIETAMWGFEADF